jgi:hypothetical protein
LVPFQKRHKLFINLTGKIKADKDKAYLSGIIKLRQFLKIGQLLNTWSTPCGPEIDNMQLIILVFQDPFQICGPDVFYSLT